MNDVTCRSYELTVEEKTYTLLPTMFQIKRYQKTVHGMALEGGWGTVIIGGRLGGCGYWREAG